MKICSLIIVPLLLITPAIEDPQRNLAENDSVGIEFRFNPPAGLTYATQAESTVRISRGSVEPEVNKGLVTTKVTVAKSENGFIFRSEPKQIKIINNGREMYNPLARVIQSSILTIEVNPRGEILSLKGYEDLAERLKKEFKAQEIKDLMAKVDLNTLADQAAKEWQSRLQGLVGHRVKAGDAWVEIERTLLSTGDSIAYYKVVTVKEKEKCGEAECVRLRFDFQTDRQKLAEQDESLLDKLPSESNEDALAIKQSSTKVSGWGELIIEPATMLIHSAHSLRRYQLLSETVDGARLVTSIMEKKEYTTQF
jgi:hypothetical protein